MKASEAATLRELTEMVADVARLSEILEQRKGENLLDAARRVKRERDYLRTLLPGANL